MVKIDVFNILGKKVITLIDAEQVAGNHQVVWDGNDTSGKASSNGVYFYRISTPEFTQTKKMILSK